MAERPSGTVTFLFTDIERSTGLLKRLGRERYGVVLADHQRLLREAFGTHRGEEIDTQGDSFFVAFRSASDAVSASVAIQRALAGHGWPDGASVLVRIGIHSGEAALEGERYLGISVHRAARIGAAGHGGQVLLSSSSRELVEDDLPEGIGLRDLGRVRLKDIERPERISQLVAQGLQLDFPALRGTLELRRERLLAARPDEPVPLPGPLVPTPSFPFVGREDELAVLRSLLERAEGGEGGLVLLAAEAGGGKTRLVRELALEAAARGVLVLYGASDAAVSTPYQPLREWLEFLLRVCDPEALRECLGGGGEALSRLVPELERVSGAPAPATDDAEGDRYLLQSAVVELLRRISRLQPLLLVVDDVHWSDGESLQLIGRLARAAPEARLLVVAGFRDRGEELSPALSDTLADLSRLDGVTRVALGKLNNDEVSAFVYASTDAAATRELASAIEELANGTPLLLCELWRDLRESGAIEVAGGGVRLTRPVSELRGPESVRDVVQQRLSRLGAETTAMLELAAVAGPQFELAVLAEAAALDRGDLVAAVEEATQHGMIEELPGQRPACRFTHELVRRAVYDRIVSIRRAELHLRVGEALEHAYEADLARVLPELAHHFTLAASVGGVERAVAYNLRAAEAATGSAARVEATARYSSALELGIDDPRERARVQVELARLLSATGLGGRRRLPQLDALLAASLDTATGLDERGVAALALVHQHGFRRLGDPQADPQEMRTVAERAVETLTELGDERGLAIAVRQLGVAFRLQGRLAECCAALECALVHAETSGDQLARQPVIGLLGYALSDGPTPVGDAIRRCEELVEAKLNDRYLEAIIIRVMSTLQAMAARFEESREHARRSDRILDEMSSQIPPESRRYVVAERKEFAGDRAGAKQELAAGWQHYREDGAYEPDALAMMYAYRLALLHCDDGQWKDAERCLDYGRDVPVPDFFRQEAVLGLAARARLAAHRGEFAEALTLAGRASELAERSDWPNLRARVWLALAEVQRRNGAIREADAAVATAVRLYEAKGNVAAAASLRAAAT